MRRCLLVIHKGRVFEVRTLWFSVFIQCLAQQKSNCSSNLGPAINGSSNDNMGIETHLLSDMLPLPCSSFPELLPIILTRKRSLMCI